MKKGRVWLVVPIVVVAAKAATMAHSLRMKSKIATPLFHPPLAYRAAFVVAAIATGAAAAALELPDFDSRIRIGVSSLSLGWSMGIF